MRVVIHIWEVVNANDVLLTRLSDYRERYDERYDAQCSQNYCSYNKTNKVFKTNNYAVAVFEKKNENR